MRPLDSSDRSGGLHDADRAAHSGAADAAVPAGILGEVLLVVVLGVEELGRVPDLGGDALVPRRGENLLVGLARGLGVAALLVVEGVDGAPVLCSRVVALAHA